QLGDPLVPEVEVEGQNQRVRQAGFVVGPVGAAWTVMSPWRSTARKGVKVTRSPKISFAAKARIASAPANSRWTSLTKASGSKVAIQASISWLLQAARWRAMVGGRSLVISLGIAGSRCLFPANAKTIGSSEEALDGQIG